MHPYYQKNAKKLKKKLFGFYQMMYREHACSDGDAYCDFKFKPGANIPAMWPPHLLDKNDPLK